VKRKRFSVEQIVAVLKPGEARLYFDGSNTSQTLWVRASSVKGF
jgi:hypothetical protein